MRIFLIKLIFLGCILLGIFSLALGVYKFAAKKNQLSSLDFLHFPLASRGFFHIKGAHNIIDGMGFIILGVVGYVIFFQ
jgi:hypothetical protein